uniref:Ig-like domain-containing protein n=1 Tax=Gopherus evgoodei TaxID=1825980 RepID=A0A8C4YCC6_9SAUR
KTAPSVFPLTSCTGEVTTSQVTFGCLAKGYFPEPVTVTWSPNVGSSGVRTYPSVLQPSSSLYSLSSQVTVPASSWESNTYRCTVEHQPTSSSISKEIPSRDGAARTPARCPTRALGAKSRPTPASAKVTLSRDGLSGENPMLTCLVVNLPSDSGLQVVWSREKPGSIIPDPLTLTEQFNSTFTASSSMPIFTRDWEAGETFTCKVEHSDLISPLIKSISKKPGNHSAPGVYLLHPHSEELSSKGDSVSVTCLVRGFFPEDISVQWMKNHEGEKETDYITTPPMKDGASDSNFFLYSKLKVSKASWNIVSSLGWNMASGYSRTPPPALGYFCSEDEDEELDGLWSSISVFITLFLLSVCYSATVTLFKVKWFFSTLVQLKKASGPEYKNVIQRVV